MNALCDDFHLIRQIPPQSDGCEECLALGDSWVHLRMCLVCGHVGCCDESQHRHASRHFHDTGHPIVKSLEPNEEWVYCFLHDIYADDLAIATGEEGP